MLHQRKLWHYRNNLNKRIATHLYKFSRLSGFTGNLSTGVQLGHSAMRNKGIPLPPWAQNLVRPVVDHSSSDDGDDSDDSDMTVEGLGAERDVNAYINFIDNLGRHNTA